MALSLDGAAAWAEVTAHQTNIVASLQGRTVPGRPLGGLRLAIAAAPPYWIAKEISDLALASEFPPLDLRLMPYELVTPSGYALFENQPVIDYDLVPDGSTRDLFDEMGADWGKLALVSAFWTLVNGNIACLFTTSAIGVNDVSGAQAASFGVWPVGGTLGEVMYEPEDEHPKHVFRLVLPLFATVMKIMGQRLTVVRHARPTRQMARSYERQYRAGPPTLHVVELRRLSQDRADHSEGHREYSHRFVVRGHWRHQWYPSRMDYDWKFVSPYVKGPNDKPLIIKKSLYLANR